MSLARVVEPIVNSRGQQTLKQTPFFLIPYQDEEKPLATRKANSTLKLATKIGNATRQSHWSDDRLSRDSAFGSARDSGWAMRPVS
jgi:hypothetical protein